MRSWIPPVAFMALMIGLIFYDANTKSQAPPIPMGRPNPSAGVYLTHEQYDRMQNRITDMEAALERSGLPIPGSRVPKG